MSKQTKQIIDRISKQRPRGKNLAAETFQIPPDFEKKMEEVINSVTEKVLTQVALQRSETETAAAMMPSPTAPVIQPRAPGDEDTMTGSQSKLLDMMNLIHSSKDDEAAQSERKDLQTKQRLRKKQFVALDTIFSSALKKFGDHIFSPDGERLPKNPKIKTETDVFGTLLFVALTQDAEYQSHALLREHLEHFEDITRFLRDNEFTSVLRFLTWNLSDAYARKRPLTSYGLMHSKLLVPKKRVVAAPAPAARAPPAPTRRAAPTFKINKPCFEWQRTGKCWRGDSCRFLHVPPSTGAQTKTMTVYQGKGGK